MSFEPLISVIMPVFNRANFVEAAIESVLAQDYTPLEFIVVDDGSTDNSERIIRQYEPQLHYYYQENAGTSVARNAGIALSTGEFLAFLDSDDVWLLHKLSSQMAVFTAEPATDVVFGHAEEFFDANLDETFRRRIRIEACSMPALTASAMLIRREMFDAVGGYNPDFLIATEPEWYMRLLEQNPVTVTLPTVVYRRRIHRNNITLANQELMRKEYLQSLHSGLARRRKSC